ncbi:RNA methyltransferase [Candidatus Uhrbacteria bacterium]|jgi:tRNA (guanosine-2'-O-)-methyltransferase|nr:MAG: RNA methyltransferase [Candidatus Uhrbacteria bacterium]
MTPERKKKIEQVMSHRQSTLAVVLENVDDPHNVGAILRSCDAFGVGEVHLLYTINKPPRNRDLKSKSAASAAKWLKITKWDSVAKLAAYLKRKKFAIAVTRLSDKSVDPASVDLKKPVAIVIGNEKDGVSEALAKKATINLKIPMVGFIQSFNVSVAAALLLYEASRQRQKKTPPGRAKLGRVVGRK